MDTRRAIAEFRGNWFLREQAKPDLTPEEQELIGAAIGPAPERWDGQPDVARMQETVAAEPAVLERIGSSLLTAVIGKRGCGPAAAFLLAHDVPLAIDHDGVQRPARGGVGRGGRYAAGGVRVGSGRRDRRLGSPATPAGRTTCH